MGHWLQGERSPRSIFLFFPFLIMSCNYQITGVFSSLCRNGMRGHWAISRFLSCPRLSDNCSNESRGRGQSEKISLIFWTFQWQKTTVADKIKLELIPRGSKYPIWPQLWIIPYHGHVPVTSRPRIHLPGGHLSHSQPPESQPLLRAPLCWAGGGDSSWRGHMWQHSQLLKMLWFVWLSFTPKNVMIFVNKT